jgi:release factor glutamine methyltransferase
MRMGVSLQAMVGRRLAGEPVQYVLGHWPFRHIDLLIDQRVLIPRPETEQVVEVALSCARQLRSDEHMLRIADIGTGCGAIGLSMANELPHDNTEVWLSDISTDALDVARANIAGIGRNARNVRVTQGSWCAGLPRELHGSFQVIVSNPPYIDEADPLVEDSVRTWEPHIALFSPNNGLRDVLGIAQEAREFLAPGGYLVCEMGFAQGDVLRAEFAQLGYVHVEVRKDFAGLDRVVMGQWATIAE